MRFVRFPRVHVPAIPAALLVLALAMSPAAGQSPGPQAPEQGAYREQPWLIPTNDGSGRLMRTVVYRPKDEVPRRMVIINHGAPTSGPATAQQPRYAAAAAWFVEHGYVVVVPQRRGYGETGGRYNESYGHCENADFVTAGQEGARDIAAAVAFMRLQPFVRQDGVVIVGQSAGGWVALAYASQNPAGVSAVVNFAGGRGGWRNNLPNNNCSPGKLVQGSAEFGRTARIPTLWLYTENDTFFDPALSRRMVESYQAAGGTAQFILLGAFGRDGHSLFSASDGVAVWSAHVKPFLDRHR